MQGDTVAAFSDALLSPQDECDGEKEDCCCDGSQELTKNRRPRESSFLLETLSLFTFCKIMNIQWTG